MDFSQDGNMANSVNGNANARAKPNMPIAGATTLPVVETSTNKKPMIGPVHENETKGRIDRYTILSQKNLDLLTEYWYKCGHPKDILFPSSWSGGYLDIASVNQFFKKSAKLAGINRHVSSHACRHSFASHLFESGTDIKYIQSLLGHVDPRSTDVYLHVSNKTLLGIRSPFDNPEGGES